MSRQKPTAGAEFDSLLGKLAQVPKEEADRRARQWKKAKKKRKKKPKQ